MTDDYDARKNSAGCYADAIAKLREQCIRRGQIKPEPGNALEERWASEGEQSSQRARLAV
jgi:hypothetical protein